MSTGIGAGGPADVNGDGRDGREGVPGQQRKGRDRGSSRPRPAVAGGDIPAPGRGRPKPRYDLAGAGAAAMIDTLSILLAHFLLGFVAIRMLNNPDLNEEPIGSGRHFKSILPKKQAPKRAGVETGEARPGSNRA